VRQLRVWVPGIPLPQGSMALFHDKKGKAYITSTNPKLKGWREIIAERVKGCGEAFVTNGPVKLVLLFYLPKPPSVTRLLPWCRPDLDKLARAVCDGITDAGVWSDDGRVVALCAEKVYAKAEPGVYIRIKEINETQEDE
jgi:Holliday junction resolvase RusA-like endonuclease